jgi:NAD+ synthase (glutamine-hydrolysing)
VTEENIQARIRAVLLMAIANKSGRLLLTTGNKSEIAVGYTTLYGDAAGGFAPLKDVFKTRVYALAAYRNARAPMIPARIIKRPPSAELAPNQTDQDSLPPYPLLDAILARYIEHDQTAADIVAAGYDAAMVSRVITMVQRAEHKRWQSPPGARVSPRAFGLDWRYPITGNFRAP